MEVRLRAEDVPVTSRREYWQHVFETVTVPYRLKGTGSDFRSRMDASEFGPARLVRADAPPGEALRTPKQVRRAAPDQRMIVVQVHGSTVWGQDDRECVLSPGDLTFIDLARPHWSALRSSGVANVRFPGQLMPLRRNEADRLCGVHFDARDDSVSLASKLVREVARDFDRHQVASRARIGSAVLDLVIAALASRVESTSPAAADSAQRALVLRIHAYIERNLSDPALSPTGVAAAHGVSVRYLHKLFEGQEATVAEWIRRRRLDRCRRELLDPGLRALPVSRIGARSGLVNAQSFNRLFRTHSGLPPAEFRAVHGDAEPTDTT